VQAQLPKVAIPRFLCHNKHIKISALFEFGRGRRLVEPIFHSSFYRRLYWPLIGFGIAFWVALIWMSFRFAELYNQ
jgi:hypothetical protein